MSSSSPFTHDHTVVFNSLLEDVKETSPYALLVINGDVAEFLPPLWRNATIRICGDGGINRVFDYFSAVCPNSSVVSLLPDVIIGDFDSARKEVLDHYQQLSVKIIHLADQNSTDLMKALNYLFNHFESSLFSISTVLIYAAFGGRFDQQIQNISTLYSYSTKFPQHQFILLSEGNLVEYLSPGHHQIHCHPVFEAANQHCGLFPIDEKATDVSTTGLRWNITHHPLGFGSFLSTCNLIDSPLITVTTDTPLIWTTEFQHAVRKQTGFS